MAYSEAEVLAGGLIHIPIIIGLLVFANSATKSRARELAENSSEHSGGANQLKSAEVEKELSKSNGGIIAETAAERIEAEEYLRIEAQTIAAEAKLKAREEKLASDSFIKLEAERIQIEEEQKSNNTNFNVDENFEARLMAEANRLEAEADIQEKKPASINNPKKEAFLLSNYSFKKIFSKVNPWQMGAVAFLAFGGFLLYQGYINTPVQTEESTLSERLLTYPKEDEFRKLKV